MKKVTYVFLFMGVTVFLAAGCTAAKNAGVAAGEGTKEAAEQVAGTTTDASITAAIKMKMADDPVVGAFEIDVDTSEGFVTLNGTVKSEAEADKAVEIAKSVEGVKSVQSNLVISG